MTELATLELVSIGTRDTTLADPRAIFEGALGAAAIILIHNHPSGDLDPNPADRAIAARLDACGLILGIDVLDHVIVYGGRYLSMRDCGK